MRAYVATAHRLIGFLGQHRGQEIGPSDLLELSAADLRAFLASRRGEGLGASSAARELSGVRAFLKYAAAQTGSHASPPRTRAPKRPRTLPRPAAPDEARTMRFHDQDDLRALWLRAGLEGVETDALVVEASYRDFDDYWEPFTSGVGPGGAFCASLDPDRRALLREECRRRLGDPDGAFALTATAWAVKGRA